MAFHSGIGTYIRSLFPFLLRGNFKLKIVASDEVITRWPELSNYDVLRVSCPIYSIHEQFELPQSIPPCDLYWAPHYNIPLRRIKARKILTTIHDVYHLDHVDQLSFMKRFYAKTMINQAVHRSHHLITVSNFSKNRIVQHTNVLPEKISVIPLGVDQKLFSKQNLSLHPKLDLPSHYFLFVGIASPRKNLDRLLEAWKKVIKKYPSYHLVIAGKQKLKFQIVDDNPSLRSNVHFLGYVEEKLLPSLYHQAFAHILPSLYEGFGLTPLEAMAMDCPVITSSTGSLPEVCKDSAIYIDPYDIEDIVAKIEMLIETPPLRKSLINKGRETVQSYAWEMCAHRHLELFENTALKS